MYKSKNQVNIKPHGQVQSLPSARRDAVRTDMPAHGVRPLR